MNFNNYLDILERGMIMGYDTYKPEWIPENADDKQFPGFVMTGVEGTGGAKPKAPTAKKKKLTAKDYIDGILNGDRVILSRAITVIESNAPKHFSLGQEIIQGILPYTGKSVRVGITGVPGAGKSTFIEALGCKLCEKGHKVAVLAVDPSSSLSHGSILGDKTRMENLSKQANAFIRPSPSGGTLGGVTRKSRETMLLCEAFGYDTILVETVGVGQSETTVRSMVDFFLMVALTGAGDDLQGIKKGIMEIADAIIVNKADGDNKPKAMMARAEFEQILHYLRPSTEGWKTHAYTCSAYTGEGVMEMWDVIEDFISQMTEAGTLKARRQQQTLEWVRHMTDEHIHNLIYQNQAVIAEIEKTEALIKEGQISATMAAKNLIERIEEQLRKGKDE
jgi:LAO/AO transport system kinase